MTHTQLKNWSASRSGATMTIKSFDGREPIVIGGIVRIEAGYPFPVAIHQNGERFELLPNARQEAKAA